MALRFQGKDDDVDRAAKKERGTAVLVLVLVFFAAIYGADDLLSGKGFASYGKDLAWLLAFGLAYWIVAPFYYEFRIRTKEIDGKVSAIEEGILAASKERAELLELLSAIEEKLESNLGDTR